MKKIRFQSTLIIIMFFIFAGNAERALHGKNEPRSNIIKLPEAKYDGNISVEKALKLRRSIRNLSKAPLSLAEISQILWAAQGITKKREAPARWNKKFKWQGGFRTAPSAGALYPMELYLVAGNVKELSPGVYKYIPQTHSLIEVMAGDKRPDVTMAAFGQGAIKKGAVSLIITAIYERTSVKYGDRAKRYVHIEAGHIGQNVYLQCIPLKMGTVFIGAFHDEALKKTLNLPKEEHPLAIMPLGKTLE